MQKANTITNNKKRSIFLSIKTILAVLLATILSIKYLDTEIAIRVIHFLKAVPMFYKVSKGIPDLLLHFVLVATALMWAMYFYRLHKKKIDAETQFLQLAATVLPAAFMEKTLLKFVFGRTSPRVSYIYNQQSTFHWFKTWHSSFPSGHMVVFAAFGAAVAIYYPKYRREILIFLILLEAALIGTDYHFLSDVIGGWYLGFATTYLVKYLIEKFLKVV